MARALDGLFLAACLLLLAAGAPKLVDPTPLVRALRSARLPAGRASVRLLAVGEVGAAVLAVFVASPFTAAAVALLYVGFTAFVVLARRRGGVLASCGCFGRPDTPPTLAHALLTGAGALVAVLVLTARMGVRPASLWPGDVASGAVLVGFAGLVAFLSYLVLAVLPTVSVAAVTSSGSFPRAEVR